MIWGVWRVDGQLAVSRAIGKHSTVFFSQSEYNSINYVIIKSS